MVHVDGILAVGEKATCDQFGRDVDEMVPVKNLGECVGTRGVFTGGIERREC